MFPVGADDRFHRDDLKPFDAMALSGQEVSVLGPWLGVDRDLASIAYFEKATDARVAYAGSDSFEQQIVIDIQAGSPPDIALRHVLADNCAMQLLRDPGQFDVIVTDNLFGDMLSDEAAMLTGSLGMLPSASLGALDAVSGRRHALYEPVHGSAPDIAGEDKANPLATLLSFAMMLRYSFDMREDADLPEAAVKAVPDAGIRTGDIARAGETPVSTTQMGKAVLAELDRRAA